MRFLIIGQGLAGTALAWEFERLGADYCVVDEGTPFTSSRVAAGLITPVTGKRFTVAEYFNELAQFATTFYQRVEAVTGTQCFVQQPALRLVYERQELHQFEKRRHHLHLNGHISLLDDEVGSYRGNPIAFSMPHAARLLTRHYLDASQRYFQQQGRYVRARVDPQHIERTSDGVWVVDDLPRAGHLVFCAGHEDQFNPRVPQELFNRAKGEILRVRIEGLGETRTVHAFKSWLCPTAKHDEYLFGSTYQHGEFEVDVTDEARIDLTQRLEQFVSNAYEVVGQSWGVRPIAVRRRAIVGCDDGGLAWLNGLGSKGALLSPYLASRLATALMHNSPFDSQWTPVHSTHAH